jgi:N-acetylmuramoyl-L-alanine amidase
MRQSGRTPRARSMATTLPAALVGSIALALTAEGAVAAPLPPPLPTTPRPQPERTPVPTAETVAVPATVSAVAAPAEYTVAPGDTVSAIAGRHGLRTADVLAANGLGWSSVIYPGQTLRLAAPAAAPEPAPAPAPAAPASHTVAAGDTVSGIARAHGVDVGAMLSANGLGWGSIIYPGQTLTIPGAAPLAATPAVAVTAAPAELDAEQTENARTIIRIGRELGVPDRGIAIALATAMVESWMRNLDWGDRDSLGLFQQRPSAGWGSAEQVRDIERATRVFYGGPADPNGAETRGLLDIPDWESLPFTDAAQAVQISAYPDRYGEWEQSAYSWLSVLG